MTHDELIAFLVERQDALITRRWAKADQMQKCDPYDPRTVERYVDFQRLDAQVMEVGSIIRELHRLELCQRREISQPQ